MKPINHEKYRLTMKLWHGYLLPLIILIAMLVLCIFVGKDIHDHDSQRAKDGKGSPVQKEFQDVNKRLDDIEKELKIIKENTSNDN